MSREEKLIYLLKNSCSNIEDVQELLAWIQNSSIDHVYHLLHFLFDEDEHLYLHNEV